MIIKSAFLRSLCLGTSLSALALGSVSCQSQTWTDDNPNNAAAKFLPFDMPSKAVLQSSKKKVFAHYFAPFPLSIDNKPAEADYYKNGYMSLHGEKDKHVKYGGYLRQRPLPRPVSLETDWAYQDVVSEVKMASDIGLDGFCYDILGTGKDSRNQKLDMLLKAAQQVDPNFKIMLMPDMCAEFSSKPENFFKLLEVIHESPALFRAPDGRIVVSPWCPKKGSAKWWKENLDAMAAKGIKIYFVPLFQAWWSYDEEFGPISDGYSDWGCGTIGEEISDARKKSPQKCHALGKLWMNPVRPQDFRPKSFCAWEADGSQLYRDMWDTAISGDAEWVQIATWSDYSEASEIAPSTGTQYGYYDLTAYYAAWFKTGKAPKITQDALYYFYRVQPSSLLADKQEKPFKIVGKAKDEIELLAFMKAPGTLQIEIDGKAFTKDFPAGVNSFKVPLAYGKPVFSLIRGGAPVVEFEGKFEIVGKADYQDLLYRAGSSLREAPKAE